MNGHTAIKPATDRGNRTGLTELVGLIAADGLSRFGTVMTVTAIPWFVLVTTGSATRTGLTVFAAGLGVVLALLFGGAVVDRLSFKRASIAADILAGLVIGFIPLSYLTIGLPFWLLLILVFIGTLFDTPAQVARYSALPDLSRRANVRFERANAIFDGVLTSASLIAPAVAGVLIAFIGARNVLWIDAATFWVSALTIRTLVPSIQSVDGDAEQFEGYLSQLSAAVRFVLREPVLLSLVTVLAIMNLAIGPIQSVILPIVAHDVFHSSYALGLMTSSIALGALAGNVVFGTVGHRLARQSVFGIGFLVVPLVYGVLLLEPALAIAIGVLTIVGLGESLTNLLEYTIYFERIPRGMRARGLGITGAMGWGTVPVGRILAGVGISALGLTATLGAFALVFIPIPIMILGGVAFRGLNMMPTVNQADA